jgi:hypothetical protein
MNAGERRYHLGLDWGTSAVKMVLRDYGAVGEPYAMVLTPDEKGVRYPSTVALLDDALWFGWEAESRRTRATKVWDSLKARAALRHGWAESSGVEGLTYANLVALCLAHAIAVGKRHADAHARSMGAVARMAMTLGAPEPDLQVRSNAYLDAVVLAYRLVAEGFDPQGQTVALCLSRLHALRERVLPMVNRSPDNRNRWLRSEVAAAMMWTFTSPLVGEGIYTVIDIGAATTNASFFQIHAQYDGHARRPKGGIAFFGAATRGPAMNEIAACIAELEFPERPDPVRVRGHERRFLKRHERHATIDGTLAEIYETWAIAKRNAWPKAPRLDHWRGLRFLVIGGGRTCPEIVRRFDRLPGYLDGKITEYRELKEPGCPNDLRQFSLAPAPPEPYVGDPTFLLVAYGLSFHVGDLPDIALPHEVPPFQRTEFRRAFTSAEELGYDEK